MTAAVGHEDHVHGDARVTSPGDRRTAAQGLVVGMGRDDEVGTPGASHIYRPRAGEQHAFDQRYNARSGKRRGPVARTPPTAAGTGCHLDTPRGEPTADGRRPMGTRVLRTVLHAALACHQPGTAMAEGGRGVSILRTTSRGQSTESSRRRQVSSTRMSEPHPEERPGRSWPHTSLRGACTSLGRIGLRRTEALPTAASVFDNPDRLLPGMIKSY